MRVSADNNTVMLLMRKFPMEETTPTTPVNIEEQLQSLAPLNVIRTETVISKLPLHNLAKKGNISIHITQRNEKGEVTLHWEVSPHPKYGVPRQLAYKLDTLVINRRIDEAGKPLPKLIRLGSLREIAQALDLETSGDSANRIKNALYQNAFAAITAKLAYEANDRTARTLEAGFTRYSIIFTGQKLPDGKKADAVYLILNEPYREVLNNAPFRPLNYDYLRELAPAPQRFYEIVSRRIFAALKYQRAEAKLRYSEYCTYSAQQRYQDYDHFKKQMYKIHRPHLASGYLKAVRYQASDDDAGGSDWVMYYTPGPKARAEYQTFARSGRMIEAATEPAGETVEIGAPSPRRRRTAPRQAYLPFTAPPPEAPAPDAAPVPAAVAELMRRGVGAAKARSLVGAADQERALDQIEWGDHLIRQARPGVYRNPPGFYVYLIAEGIMPPDRFETRRKEKRREDAYATQVREQTERFELEDAYRDYRAAEIDRYIASQMVPEEFDAMVRDRENHRKTDRWTKNLPATTIREIAEREVRAQIAGRIPTLLTLEQFSEERRAKTPQAPTAG
jgi:hypothetical protein